MTDKIATLHFRAKDNYGTMVFYPNSLRDKARAAIAKAEGRA